MNVPVYDNPSETNTLIAAMEAAGYAFDSLESTDDNLCFFGEGGQTMTMGGWKECEDWLNGVVFDDPQISDHVESILHPDRFPSSIPSAYNESNTKIWEALIPGHPRYQTIFRNQR